MRKLKIVRWLLVAFVVGSVYTSCSKDQDVTPDLYSVIATLCQTDDGAWFFTDDAGSTLQLIPAINFRDVYKGKRFYLEFAPQNKKTDFDLTVQLYHIEQVVVQPLLTIAGKEKRDSVGHDPIDVYGMWASGTFVNLMYGIYWEGNKAHQINLVRDTTPVEMNGIIPVVHLNLCHNAHNEATLQSYSGIMSFDYKDMLPAFSADSIRLSVSYKNYSGEQKTTEMVVPTKTLQKNASTPYKRASKRLR